MHHGHTRRCVVTAPDPGLTDLIAAHYRHCISEEIRLDPETGVHTNWIECTCVCGADTSVEVIGDREAAVRLADAAHVALVVEQHTNGRTAELGWDELVAAIPDGWELRESAQLEEVSRVRQRDLEASQATTARWRARADKAEAAIAKVEAEAALLERMIRTAPWSRYTEVRRSHLRSLCAALEGPGEAG